MKYIVDLEDIKYLDNIKKHCEVLIVHQQIESCIIDVDEKKAEIIKKVPGVLRVIPSVQANLLYKQDVVYSENEGWALGHISNSGNKYIFPTTGKNVDIFIIDTGINPMHIESSPLSVEQYERIDMSESKEKIQLISNAKDNVIKYWCIDGWPSRAYGAHKGKNAPESVPIKKIHSTANSFVVELNNDIKAKNILDYIEKNKAYVNLVSINFPIAEKYKELGTVILHIRYGVFYKRLENYVFECEKPYFAQENVTNVNVGYLSTHSLGREHRNLITRWTKSERFDCLIPVYYEGYSKENIINFIMPGRVIDHGSAVATCAGGRFYGTAKDAHCIGCVTNLYDYHIASCIEIITKYHQKKIKNNIMRHTVINMSLGLKTTPEYLPYYEYVLDIAIKAGIIIVVAGGNDKLLIKRKEGWWPATYEKVITVGSLDYNDNLSYYSNYGSGVDLFAPGRRVKTSYFPVISVDSEMATALDIYSKSYTSSSGTSYASPFTAGVVACALEAKGDDIYKTEAEVLSFREWFLQNYTRRWTPVKHYKGPFRPNAQDLADPNNYGDGWPADDDGSPNRCLFMNRSIWEKKGTFSKVPKIPDGKCINPNLTICYDYGYNRVRIFETNSNILIGMMTQPLIGETRVFHGRDGIYSITPSKETDDFIEFTVSTPMKAGVLAQ